MNMQPSQESHSDRTHLLEAQQATAEQQLYDTFEALRQFLQKDNKAIKDQIDKYYAEVNHMSENDIVAACNELREEHKLEEKLGKDPAYAIALFRRLIHLVGQKAKKAEAVL